jgi:tetratricopeptide (TPR) repeat protein
MDAYPGTLVAEEAELSIAEAVAWEMLHPAEAVELFSRALEHLRNPRLIARGTVGLAFPLNMMGEFTEAFDLLSSFIEAHPNHPGVPLAKAYRCYAAGKLGWWEVAAADAEDFLAAPIGQYGHPWAHNSENALGQVAFQRGDIAAAQLHFERALAAAPDPDGEAQSAAGIGHCQLAAGSATAAIESFLSAAAAATRERTQCMYLHQAARAAEQAGDAATFNQIVGQMVEEFPGSYLTTRLVGYEILPAPEL